MSNLSYWALGAASARAGERPECWGRAPRTLDDRRAWNNGYNFARQAMEDERAYQAAVEARARVLAGEERTVSLGRVEAELQVSRESKLVTALWDCITALERHHHIDEDGRFAAANRARETVHQLTVARAED